MKTYLATIISLLIFSSFCLGQNNSTQTLSNQEFNWTMQLPVGFERVDAKEWMRLQNRGQDAIEDTYEGEVVNQTQPIFVFKSGQFNYIEANVQPFDLEIEGDYLETRRQLGVVLYETFMAQMPGVKVDTSFATETIDGLNFQRFQFKVQYPNSVVLYGLMYSRLFDERDLTVNIIYLDEAKGAEMLEAWRASRFGEE
ncbi:MAG: hypothetical protein AAF804_04155 [Bacteroidota bacterium]